MSDIKDGGSAFPSHGSMGEVAQDGMTLRDYFAGQAMVGILHFWVQVRTVTNIKDPEADTVAGMAYEYADAMLKARG